MRCTSSQLQPSGWQFVPNWSRQEGTHTNMAFLFHGSSDPHLARGGEAVRDGLGSETGLNMACGKVERYVYTCIFSHVMLLYAALCYVMVCDSMIYCIMLYYCISCHIISYHIIL